MKPIPMRPAAAAIVAAIVLALVAACGGSASSARRGPASGGPSSPGNGGASSSFAAHALAFARCVRAHGVPNFPDPNGNGAFSKQALEQLGVSKAQLRAAMKPCPFPTGRAPLTARDQQDYLRAAACMRSHGLPSFPDPTFSGGTVNFPIPSSIDANSQTFDQARQTCSRLIPPGLPYSRTGS